MANDHTLAALWHKKVKDKGDLVQHLREGIMFRVFWCRAQSMAHHIWCYNLQMTRNIHSTGLSLCSCFLTDKPGTVKMTVLNIHKHCKR